MSYNLEVQNTIEKCLAQSANKLIQTNVQGVKLFWGCETSLSEPLIYEKGLFFLLQGEKKIEIGSHHFTYNSNQFLIVPSPVAVSSSYYASYEKPTCGLFIEFSRQNIQKILTKLPIVHKKNNKKQKIIAQNEILKPIVINENMRVAIHRLLTILNDDISANILGESIHHEILFYALYNLENPALKSYLCKNSNDDKLAKLIEDIHSDIAQHINVKEMAKSINMSESSFYRAFVRRTGQSPLQYVKQLRLHEARNIMISQGVGVGQAANIVGYESQSQFSREFKKYFNISAKDCHNHDEYFWNFSSSK